MKKEEAVKNEKENKIRKSIIDNLFNSITIIKKLYI
jgi:hypothetical protein